ncbi:MAG: helix-turn-helix transcriptional regulator [Gemmatimonadales bacterium]|nr:helix-turn-helix transcriptional regulator [Gemmatimonadales bacterium]
MQPSPYALRAVPRTADPVTGPLTRNLTRLLDRWGMVAAIYDLSGRLRLKTDHWMRAFGASAARHESAAARHAERVGATHAGAAFAEEAWQSESGRHKFEMTLVTPEAATAFAVVRATRIAAAAAPEIIEGLTPRQHDIARRLALGASNREIARELGISENTVRRHVEQVLHRLGVVRRGQVAARLAGQAEPHAA